MRGDDLDAEFPLKMFDPDEPNESGLLPPRFISSGVDGAPPDGTAGITGPILESWAPFLGPVRPAASSEAFVKACSRSS